MKGRVPFAVPTLLPLLSRILYSASPNSHYLTLHNCRHRLATAAYRWWRAHWATRPSNLLFWTFMRTAVHTTTRGHGVDASLQAIQPVTIAIDAAPVCPSGFSRQPEDDSLRHHPAIERWHSDAVFPKHQRALACPRHGLPFLQHRRLWARVFWTLAGGSRAVALLARCPCLRLATASSGSPTTSLQTLPAYTTAASVAWR